MQNFIVNLIDDNLLNIYTLLEKSLKSKKNITDNEISDIIQKCFEQIDIQAIKNTISEPENVIIILNIVKKYIILALLTIVAIYSKDKNYDSFVMKFSEKQKDKINLTPDYISSIIKYISLFYSVTQKKVSRFESLIPTTDLLNKPENNISKLINNTLTTYTTIKDIFSVVRVFLFKIEFTTIDKSDINKILDDEMFSNSEIAYIDIVIDNSYKLDILEIETLITEEESNQAIGDNAYMLLLNATNKDYQNLDDSILNKKILNLLNSQLVIPITNEFLLYHNNNEFYSKLDKSIEKTHEIDITTRSTLMEDFKESKLKIDYIIDKISKAENDEPKIFNEVTKSKQAITINEYEDIKLINKMSKQSNQLIKDNLNLFLNYRQSVFINFKNIIGFTINLENAIMSLRYSSLKSLLKNHSMVEDDSKLSSKSNIQARSCGKYQNINIVGFAIIDQPINCDSVNKLNINNVKYGDFIDQVKNKINNKSYDNCYWIFYIDEDIKLLNTYMNISNDKINTQETQYTCKLLTEYFYDDILRLINDDVLNILLKRDKLSMKKIENILVKYFMPYVQMNFDIMTIDFLNISDSDRIKIYNKLSKDLRDDAHDNKAEELYGLNNNTIKLSTINIEKKKSIFQISATIDDINNKLRLNNLQENAICYHFILWDNIEKEIKLNPVNFNNLLFDFASKYVEESFNGVYVCKSCGQRINLEKYVPDGQYDKNKRFIIFGSVVNIKLEDLPEYKKFSGYEGVLHRLDNLVDKLSNILNMVYLSGNGIKQKIARKQIVKNTIDMLIANNSLLDKKNMNIRYDASQQEYNINSKITDFYSFDLDNSIFKNISDDKDFYRNKKYNNVIIYVLISILLEIDRSHVMDISKHKNCDYKTFKIYFKQLFGQIKIKLENSVVNISNYPVLCFIIYVFACVISKYNIYYVTNPKQNVKTKINSVIMLKVVQTLIDVLNSFVENYIKIYSTQKTIKSSTYQLYQIFYFKYSGKIETLYGQQELLDMLESPELSLLKLDKRIKDKYDIGNFSFFTHPINEILTLLANQERNIKFVNKNILFENNFFHKDYSILTNCPSGKLHKWNYNFKFKTILCSECEQTYEDILQIQPKSTSSILYELLKELLLRKLANRYCISDITSKSEINKSKKSKDLLTGIPHLWNLDSKSNIKYCIRCKYVEEEYLPINKLDYLEKVLYAPNILQEFKSEPKKQIKQFEKLNDNIIDNFINLISSIHGNVIDIDLISINLLQNKYIFDHNNLGFDLPNNLIVLENNIKFQNNNSFFKEDVYYYTLNKIDTYYSNKTNFLLGYREHNKNYIKSNLKNLYQSKINYSFINQIKYLLFRSIYVNVSNIIDIKYVFDILYSNAYHFINTLLINLMLISTQKPISKSERNTFKVDKYYRKLKSIKYYNIFNNWKEIIKTINADQDVTKYNTINCISHGNVDETLSPTLKVIQKQQCDKNLFILCTTFENNYILYIINELIELINMNDKALRVDITIFIVDFINHMFNGFKINLENEHEIIKYENKISTISDGNEFLLYFKDYSGHESSIKDLYYKSEKKTTLDDTELRNDVNTVVLLQPDINNQELDNDRIKEEDNGDIVDSDEDLSEDQSFDIDQSDEELDDHTNMDFVQFNRISSQWDIEFPNNLYID